MWGFNMNHWTESHPVRLDVDYPEQLGRLTTLFRIVLAIPILVIAIVISGADTQTTYNEAGEAVRSTGGIGASLALATALMIVFRRRYPRWWFDFVREMARFGGRVFAYLALLTDKYPSTVDEQAVHLEIDYPDVRELNRWLPLVKWLLALPHYIVLVILSALSTLAVIAAWFCIVVTGRYPRSLFDFVVGTFRWWLRVGAYAFLLVIDSYPPFSLR